MTDYIGLSFSAENINIAHFLKSENELILKNLSNLDYPFHYEESTFFNDDNIVRLANSLMNRFEALNVKDPDVSISVESNFAQIKRIALPDNLNADERKNHIQWELSQSLISSLDNYIYITTDNMHKKANVNELLVIAIQKKVVDFFQKLASFCKFDITNLGINQLSAEICFQNAVEHSAPGLNILFKITSNRLETIYLVGGNYHSSLYEKSVSNNSVENDNLRIVEQLKTNTKYIEHIFEQFGKDKVVVNSIYLFGSRINDELLESIRKNISIPVEELNPVSNLKIDSELETKLPDFNELFNYVESIGIALDL